MAEDCTRVKETKQQFRMFFNAVLNRDDSQEEALSTSHALRTVNSASGL